MEPLDLSNDELEEIDADEASSVDEFIKELEEKEKDLHIPSDLVIEVGDSEVEHENIHDSFIPQPDIAVAPPDPPPPVVNPIEANGQASTKEDQEKIQRILDERDEFRESLRRQKRDFDNYRQRTERERKDMFKNMVGSLATQMLPVLDNLNRALDATMSSEEEADAPEMREFLEGIVLVNQQLNEVLAGMGVQPIPSVGESFDPNIHEAVASVETDEHPPRTVIQELLRGYKVDDKVIRASMVKVSASVTSQNSYPPEAE